LVSAFKIRIDLPSERAASGSFRAPNRSTNTATTISTCHGLRLLKPIVILLVLLLPGHVAPLISLVVAGRLEGDLHAICTRSASLLHTRELRTAEQIDPSGVVLMASRQHRAAPFADPSGCGKW